MARYAKEMPTWMKIVTAILVAAIIFLLISLVWAAVVDMNIVDMWRSWFGIAITEPEPVEAALQGLG